jgi:hypothetical protein
VRQVHAQQDATGKVHTAVANLAAVYGSLVPLYLAVRAAVDAEPSAEQLWNTRTAERRAGLEPSQQPEHRMLIRKRETRTRVVP